VPPSRCRAKKRTELSSAKTGTSWCLPGLALISAAAWTTEQTSAQQAGRLLDLIIDGLRLAQDSDIQTERVAPR
jgi:hypothetical protein